MVGGRTRGSKAKRCAYDNGAEIRNKYDVQTSCRSLLTFVPRCALVIQQRVFRC